MKNKELRNSLKLYKNSLGEERLKVREEARQKVEVGQLRVLFWMPEEYVLIYEMEEGGLAHCIPLTIWCELTTVPLRIYTRDKILAPLPFIIYIREEILEEESIPIAIVKEETIEKVLKSVERAPAWSAKREKREFIKLVWSRYQKLTLASILHTHIQREEQAKTQKQKAIIVSFPAYLYESKREILKAYRRAAKTSALRGENWLGVVEEDKVVIYLPEKCKGKRIRIKLFDSVIYEGEGEGKLIIENLPAELKSHEYMEEHLNVEFLED